MEITDRARRLAVRAARLPKRAGRKLTEITPELPSVSEAKERITSRVTRPWSDQSSAGDDNSTQSAAPSEHAATGARPKRSGGSDDPVVRAQAIAADTHTRAHDAIERARSVAGEALGAEGRADEARRRAANRTTPRRNSIDDDRANSLDDDSGGDDDDTAVRSDLAERTKDELYELAKEHDIDGRSFMDKDELVEALRQHDVDA